MERLQASLSEHGLAEEGRARKTPEMGAVLAAQWTPVVTNISGPMRMRLIADLLSGRPADTGVALVAVSGKTLGNFDVIADARAQGRIMVRQHDDNSGQESFKVWSSFLPRRAPRKPVRDFTLPQYRIQTEINAGMAATVVTRVKLKVGENPARAFPFELARAMQVTRVRIDGADAEVMRDDSVRGRIQGNGGGNGEESQLLVISAAPLAAGSEHEFEFEHHGNVILTRGNGVYYVDARGAWYPHVNSGFATYDLTFRYPKRLTLVAAGDPVEDRVEGEWRVTRRRTAVAIGAAGFNLGDYEKVTGTGGGVTFEVYGNRNLEDALRPKVTFSAPSQVGLAAPRARGALSQPPAADIAPLAVVPDPRGRLQAVAGDLSASLDFFSSLFGPPLLKRITVAPISATFGQGFPGLIYLSTFAYIEPGERPSALRNAREQVFFSDLMVPHEVAHQWWGSLIATEGSEDEWLLEALANYSSLLWMEKKKGAREMQKVLDEYRGELLAKGPDGDAYEAAGPIVWGDRLASSRAPNTWRIVVYGKGTWILHMLRRRMGDEAFLKALAEFRRRFEFKNVTTADFRAVMREFRPQGVSAEAIDSFFDNWVYGTGVPTLKLKYTLKGVAPDVRVSGTLEQSGVDDDFSVDVPIEIQNGKGPAQIVWVRSGGKETAFTANVKQPPTRVGIAADVLASR